jgi:hypothetical protein
MRVAPGRPVINLVKFIEPELERIEGGAQRETGVGLTDSPEPFLDRCDLPIDQGADAGLGSNLLPAPGDFLDDARSFVAPDPL